MKKSSYRLLTTVAALWLTVFFSAGSDSIQRTQRAFDGTKGSLAATFVVNTTTDSVDVAPGDGNCADANGACSLRAAITEANALPGADIITLPAGTYTTTLTPGGHEDNNVNGDLDINSDVTINGAGSGATIVQADASPGVAEERVFHCRFVAPSAVIVINDITIRHGRYFGVTNGAGLRVDVGPANVTLNRVVVTDNQNASNGGGIAVSSATGATLNINDSTISNNTTGGTNAATARGGGIYLSSNNVTANISGSTITGNTASNTSTSQDVLGGGITVRGTGNVTNISNSIISNNTASSTGRNVFGGGIYIDEGTTTITGSTISGNVSTTPSAQTGTGWAGGIYNQESTVHLLNSVVTGNLSNRNGGVRTLAETVAATTNITECTVSDNETDFDGGGVANYSIGTANSIVNISRSTIFDNFATESAGRAGGIVNQSLSTGAATVNVTNSTIVGNSAFEAGGVYNSGSTATVNLNYATVTFNFAGQGRGDGLYQDPSGGGVINLKNSIVANNLDAADNGDDIFGTITSQDYNHIKNTSGGTFVALANDVTGSDPGLGFLQNNGGPTLTHLPGAASAVLDTIPNGTSDCGTIITFDQRGTAFPRPYGGACDKGSVERMPQPLVLTEAASRKNHGFGPLRINLPLTGNPGVECRSSGGLHTLVFTFTNNVVSGDAEVTSGTGVAGSPTFAGNRMTVGLSGVADAQTITVTLSNVTDDFAQVLPDTAVSANMLIGDTTGNKSVNSSDVSQTKAQSGTVVSEANCRQDVTVDGSINSSDTALVKSRSGTGIASPPQQTSQRLRKDR